MSLEFNINEDANLLLLSEVQKKLDRIALGGGTDKIKKQHEEGKLTARERISFLIDKN